VTGGAGFIGSHLAEALIAAGHDVLVVDDLSTGAKENLRALEGHARFRATFASCDDERVLDDAIAGCDVIYHLAAAVGVELIIARPVETIERNVRLTEALLEAAAARPRPPQVIFTSTSEVYGKSAAVPFREDGDVVLGPTTKARWSYACSKLLDEFLLLAYMREKQVPVTIFRLFNTVGPRQSGRYGMVLPRFIEQARGGGPLTVHGDGTQTRAFCDVADVVRGLVAASGERSVRGEVVNLGSPDEISIRALAEQVRERVRPDARIDLVPYERAYAPGFEDMPRRVPDVSKAARLLSWRATISLAQTIDRILEAAPA
jgi:UDP-glucose 4-epimerase